VELCVKEGTCRQRNGKMAAAVAAALHGSFGTLQSRLAPADFSPRARLTACRFDVLFGRCSVITPPLRRTDRYTLFTERADLLLRTSHAHILSNSFTHEGCESAHSKGQVKSRLSAKQGKPQRVARSMAAGGGTPQNGEHWVSIKKDPEGKS
jgi:hypothetical protein